MPAASDAKGPFGIALRAARVSAGISQEVLAAGSGVPQHQISRLERGDDPRVGEALAFEVAFGMRRGELLIAAGFVDVPVTARDALETDPQLPRDVRSVLVSAYDAAVAAHRRRQGTTDDVGEAS